MKKIAALLIAIVSLVLLTPIPSGAAALMLYDRDTDFLLIVDDQSTDDESNILGVIQWSGAIGVWDINVTTGITKPIIGSNTSPMMHLNTVNHSTQAGNLFIGLYDSFALAEYALSLAIGGVSIGESTAWIWDPDSGNSYFSQDFAAGPYSDLSFATFTSELFGIGIDFRHLVAGVSSVDLDLKPVPEPATMLLLGSGLVGLAGWGRKKFRI